MGPDPSEISAQEHRIKLCMNGLLRLVVKSTLGCQSRKVLDRNKKKPSANLKKGWKTETIVIDPSMNIYFSFPLCWMAMTTLKKCINRKKIPLISYFMIFFYYQM